MSIRPRIRELSAYAFEGHRGNVKLDQNELPVDLPDSLRVDLLARLQDVVLNRYPDLDGRELRSRLADMHDWEEDGVVVTPGSNTLIQCLTIAAGIDQTVLIPTPTFGVYRLQARMLGARLVEVPMGRGFALPTGAMIEEMRGGRGIVFVANPAAPTGNLHPRSELERLIDAAGSDWTVVIDEAYAQFAGTDFSDLARKPQVVSLRTLSKAFGLAGARVGYALARPELAREVRKTVNPFPISALQQAAALTVIEHHDEVLERAREVARERDRLARSLAGLPGVELFPSVTNFLLLKVPDAPRVYRELLGQGVIVRPQSDPALRDCIRVSVGLSHENETLVAALRGALQEVEHG